MRLIKAFGVGATGLFIIITLFSLLIPSRVRVSRAVQIYNTSVSKVYPQIARFNNWKNWHPVFTLDSACLKCKPAAIIGKDSGCIIRHQGRDIEIRLLSTDSISTQFLLQAEGENDVHNDIVITGLPLQQAVQVEWRATTKLHWYPWEKVQGIFMDNITGPGYEAALNALKRYLEKPVQAKATLADN